MSGKKFSELGLILSRKSTFVFDCDGVLWRGNQILPGVKDFFALLREHKKNVFFVTNNSSKTRDEYVKKFANVGIQASVDEVFGTAFLAAHYFTKNPPNGKLYVMGNSGIQQELAKVKGLEIITEEKDYSLDKIDADAWSSARLDENVGAVLIGFDAHFNFTKILKATSYVKQGAKFIVTNEDAELPLGRDDLCVPGVGCIVAAAKKAVGEPNVVCGKPSTLAFELIQERLGNLDRSEFVMFGDRLDTDIVFGKNCGIDTVLTLTGVTSREILKKSQVEPTHVIENFTDLLQN